MNLFIEHKQTHRLQKQIFGLGRRDKFGLQLTYADYYI